MGHAFQDARAIVPVQPAPVALGAIEPVGQIQFTRLRDGHLPHLGMRIGDQDRTHRTDQHLQIIAAVAGKERRFQTAPDTAHQKLDGVPLGRLRRQDVEQSDPSGLVDAPDQIGANLMALQTCANPGAQRLRIEIGRGVIAQFERPLLFAFLLVQSVEIGQPVGDVRRSGPVGGDLGLPVLHPLPDPIDDDMQTGSDIADDEIGRR